MAELKPLCSISFKPAMVQPLGEVARIERRKKAIPQAQSAVADVINSSLICIVTPTVSKSDLTRFIFLLVPLSVAIQVIEWPIAIAVLGMALITCTFRSSC